MKQLLTILITVLILVSCSDQKKNLNNEEIQRKIALAKSNIENYKYPEALDAVNDITGESFEANYYAACAYRKLEKYAIAEKKFREVYQVNPGYEKTCFYIASCILMQIDYSKPSIYQTISSHNECISLITEGLKYKKVLPKDFLASYYDCRGKLYQLQSNYTKALEDINTALRLDEKGPYYSDRGLTFHAMGLDDAACEDFKKGKEMGEVYTEEKIREICK